MTPQEPESPKVREEEEADTQSVPSGSVSWDVTLEPPDGSALPPDPQGTELIFQFPFDQGGTGQIWQAVQTNLKRTVAVKRLLDEHYQRHLSDSLKVHAMERRFREEARITASLEHPNIVPVYDLRTDSAGRPLLVMKLVNGTPWLRLLRQDFREMEYEAYLAKHLPIFLAMMQAVAFAHSRGILHLDLKPSQVMVGEFGEILLMDWGLAMPVDALPNGGRMAIPAGTPVMMSPEQAGAEDFPVGFHTDIYLLGGTLYFILTNRYPHEATNTPKAVEMARSGKIDHPASLVPHLVVPQRLSDLAMRAMKFNPSERPVVVSDLAAAIQDYLSGAATRREAIEIVEHVRRELRSLELMQAAAKSSSAPYEKLAEFQSRLLYAAGLWKRTPGLDELRDQVAEFYFAVAVKSGDLRLAQTILGPINDKARRQTLKSRLTEAERARRRRGTALRMTSVAAGLLTILLIAGSIRYAMDMYAASVELAQQRDVAEAARAQAVAAHQATIAERNALDRARIKAEEEQYLSSIRLIERNIQDLRIREAENQLALVATQQVRGPEWGILASRLNNTEMTLLRVDPPARLHWGDFSRDGKRIVTADNDASLMIWNAATGERIRQTTLSKRGLWYAVYSPDDTRLLVTSFDNSARILDAQTLDVIHVLEGHSELLRGGNWSPDGKRVVTTSQDRTARMWDAETGTELFLLPDVPSPTQAAEFSPDGKHLALVGANFASIRDPETGRILHRLLNHPENILDVSFSPDGNRVATACTDRNIRVFDVVTGSLLRTIPNRTSWLHSVDFDPSGQRLVSSDNDGTVRIWNSYTGDTLQEMHSPAQAFRVRFSPDGSRIVSASPTQISVWSAAGVLGTPALPPLEGPPDFPTPLIPIRAWGTPLEYTVARSEMWDPPGFRFFSGPDGDTVLAHSYYMAPSPDFRQAIWLNPRNGTATVREIQKWSDVDQLPGGPYCFFRWLPDGTRFLSADFEGSVSVWDAVTRKPTSVLLPPDGAERKPGEYPAYFALSDDGTRLAIIRRDQLIRLYDAKTLKPLRTIPYEDGSPAYVALSPDGALVAAGGHSYRSKIFDTETGELISTTGGHEGVVTGGFFWKDGSRLITWGADDRVIMHETRGGREVLTIANVVQKEGVVGVAVSSNWNSIMLQLSNVEVYNYSILPTPVTETPGLGMDIARQLEAFKRAQRSGRHVSAADIDWSIPPRITD